jgi:rubredoxin
VSRTRVMVTGDLWACDGCGLIFAYDILAKTQSGMEIHRCPVCDAEVGW